MSRLLVSSGSLLEPEIGFSRAVRVGNHVAVAGTAPIGVDGATVGVGDMAAQTKHCLRIGLQALAEAGAGPDHVIRSRILLTDITRWRAGAAAHGAIFAKVRPACTFVEVSRFIDPDWLVEIELDAIIESET